MRKLTAYTALLAVLMLPAPGRAETRPCDRACLSAFLDTYFVALAAHNPTLLPTSSQIRFTENSAERKLGQGLWQSAGLPTYRIDAVDPQSGQVAANVVLPENGKPVIAFVRLKITDRQVTELETVIVRRGEGQLSMPDTLTAVPPTFRAPVPVSDRTSRNHLIAAADAYLDALNTSGTPAYVAPPLADDMQRVENGLRTSGMSIDGKAPKSVLQQLDDGLFGGSGKGPSLRVTDRRHPVVDEDAGIVLAIGIMNLDLPAGMADLPGLHTVSKQKRKQTLVEFFKVSGGKVREIQATMLDLDDPTLQTTGWPSSPPPNPAPKFDFANMQAPPLPVVTGLRSYGLVVENLDEALRFYRDTLGLEIIAARTKPILDPSFNAVMNTPGARVRFARLRIPNEPFALELTEFTGIARNAVLSQHNDPGSSFLNIGFVDVLKIFDRIAQSRVTLVGNARIPKSVGPLTALWVRDPDGHLIEIMNAGWDIERKSLVGIDNAYRAHFGITVDDHLTALHFYRDRLGFDIEDGFPPMQKAGQYMPVGPMGAGLGVPADAKMAGIQGHCASARCEMFEFKDAPRTPFLPPMQAPGAAYLSVWVSDLDAILTTLKAEGATVITVGGLPVTITSVQQAGWVPQGDQAPVRTEASREVLVRDPAGFPILLMQPIKPAKTTP